MESLRVLKLLCLGACCILCACGQRDVVAPVAQPSGQAEALFSRAEEKFQSAAYEEALVLYNDYVERFADQPLADAALMKIGRIQTLQGDYPQARRTFGRIITEYPAGAFAQDAEVEILDVLAKEGAYKEVIAEAAGVLQSVSAPDHVFRTYAIVGDAYLALGSPVDAVEFYSQARHFAPEADRGAVDAKLTEAILQLSPQEAETFLNRTDETFPLDMLLFQLGRRHMEKQQYSQALALFEQFNARFPHHANRRVVDQMIDDINRNAVFDRNTIGCLLPLSGDYEAFGRRAMRGIELALDDFQRRIGAAPIHVLVKDTGSDPDQTLQAMRELHAARVAAVIGPLVHVELAAREAQAMGIPIVTITQKDAIPAIGENVFRNFLTPRMQVHALVSYAVEKLGIMRFAILYPDEAYGHTFMNLFWDELLAYGGLVAGSEAYDPSQTDFGDPIKKLVGLYYPVPEDLKASRPKGNPSESHRKRGRLARTASGDESDEELEAIVDFDAIFIPDAPNIAGLIIPQLAFYDVRQVLLMGTNLWHSETLLSLAQQYVQGALLPDGFFAESASPLVQAFVAHFEAAFQEKPGFIEAILYDSAMILFEVLRRPDLRFRADIRAALSSEEGFEGVTGHTRFDATGEAAKRTFLLQIAGDEFVEVDQR